LLDNGKVLIFGGMTSNSGTTQTYRKDAEIYDPYTNSFSTVSASTMMYSLYMSKTISGTNVPEYLIADDQTTLLPTVPKTFNIDVTLPSLTGVSNGQMLTICSSSASTSNNYTIKITPATVSGATDILLYSGNYNKPSVTLVAEKGTTNRWIAIDNAG
jgi:hypothetical protein